MHIEVSLYANSHKCDVLLFELSLNESSKPNVDTRVGFNNYIHLNSFIVDSIIGPGSQDCRSVEQFGICHYSL